MEKQKAQIVELFEIASKNKISLNKKRVNEAWEFAVIAHYGQKRITGDDYVIHCLETAKILAGWKLDESSIIAGILHDTIEDCNIKKEELETQFGEDVALLVDGVSKVSRVRLIGSESQEFVENLRKMFLVMAKDIRVVIVKLADRLHNMRTLHALNVQKQIKIAKETLDVYAPLAERLGMGEVKGELDDLGFKYAYANEYDEVLRDSKKHFAEAEEHIKKMRRSIKRELRKEGIEVTVQARKKHLYSLWLKLKRNSIDGDYTKIHDIVALRIITKDIADCYVVLGVIHALWKPVPHLGISDFIAQPKPNGYQSIHTKVFGPGNRIVEVQIRTKAMHEEAEYGIASHWAYAEEKNRGASEARLDKLGIKADRRKLNWVKLLNKWQEEINDSEEFMRAVKFDALNHRNFVFSPKGDVYDLPFGATPIDFAYSVHTGLGNYIKGAKVNGMIVSLDYKLCSGDVCEIIKSKNPHEPNRNWLRFVSTTTAKRAIMKTSRD